MLSQNFSDPVKLFIANNEGYHFINLNLIQLNLLEKVSLGSSCNGKTARAPPTLFMTLNCTDLRSELNFRNEEVTTFIHFWGFLMYQY